jgi:hypothetical protein
MRYPLHRLLLLLCRYGAKDFSEVRNPSALFMATVKTVAGPDALAPGGLLLWFIAMRAFQSCCCSHVRYPLLPFLLLCRYGAKDFSEVCNPSALFMATVKTVAGPDALAPGGGGGGYMHAFQCYSHVRYLSHPLLLLLCRYGAKDFSEVRNPSALFMATVKTVAGPDALAPGGGGGGYHASSSHRSADRGHYGPPSSSYGGAAAAGGLGGPTPRSYPGYGSLGGANNSYNDDDQPPPPPRQYAAAGGLGGLGMLGAAAAAGGPVSADGLSLLAGGAVLQQPGVQLMAPAGLAGIAPGTVIMAAGVGGVQQQYIVSAGGVLTAVPAGATVIGGTPGAGYAVQVRGSTAVLLCVMCCCISLSQWLLQQRQQYSNTCHLLDRCNVL